MTPRAADRKRMIAELQNARDPLWDDFAVANKRTDWALRMARKGGDYPLLGRGDINLYSLFVERAMTLVKPQWHDRATYALRDRCGQDGGEVLQASGH